MWTERVFEGAIRGSLIKDFAEDQARELWATYEYSRSRLVNDIYTEMPAANPELSDHTASHVADVLDKLSFLLDGEESQLNGAEMYCLGMIALFHDVGNLFGREGHERKVGDVFDWVRGTDANVRRERTVVLTATRAHTGLASDGTPDTLKEVPEQDHLLGKPLRLQELAGLLRFADELAEGPRRTSEFRRQMNLYEPDARIYHLYASVTNVFVDRGTERVLLTYEINVDEFTSTNDEGEDDGGELRDLLTFIYWRASKLDQERRYARYYTDLLGPFKSTWVQLNFHSRGRLLEVGLPSLVLNDKFIPGETSKELPEIDPAYEVEEVVQRVHETLDKGEFEGREGGVR